ncbi:crosslink repair DNA glycosylase YcaQ family protein [Sodalis sp. dw_96]|uniref:winged helix-turn-helix domain-containing protein n=1 Tax=Sodalis sp. dw_96 TaxID=2719794 RepID=UPI001BD38233|nr:crosslink repair DNA glycosylase YcaQ family protein [Sodalis sp. dw_96]
MSDQSFAVSPARAREIWLHAQRLDVAAPFGEGPDAVRLAAEHLGYIQIDTINVIERAHHHILYSRIPAYRRADLDLAQSLNKSVFEYWTHALAYVPFSAYPMYVSAMDRFRAEPSPSFAGLEEDDYAALLRRIRDEGPLSIRDIEEALVEKTHPWGSRKPSRRALRFGFFTGDLTVSKRTGMVKSYDLSSRHFGWRRRPRPVNDAQLAEYLLRRALQSQGMVSVDSICYGNAQHKAPIRLAIESEVKRKRLVPVHIEGSAKVPHWVEPAWLEMKPDPEPVPLVHILSPFDPLVIQRKRLQLFFGYEHRFEAYVPAAKRQLGYFALPVLAGNEIVAAIDLKMDRPTGKLLMRQWTWMVEQRPELRLMIDEALGPFERFQKL